MTEANSKIQEWLGKLSETENKLQLKTQELKHAKETIQQLEVIVSFCTVSVRKILCRKIYFTFQAF